MNWTPCFFGIATVGLTLSIGGWVAKHLAFSQALVGICCIALSPVGVCFCVRVLLRRPTRFFLLTVLRGLD